MHSERMDFFMALNKLWDDFSLQAGMLPTQPFHPGQCSSSGVSEGPSSGLRGAGAADKSRYILPLDLFFRRFLRSFYFNPNDCKTLT